MNSPWARRVLASVVVGAGVVVLGAGVVALPVASVRGGTRHADPAQVIPIEQVAPEHRDSVAEVITAPTFHRKGTPDPFPCNPSLYLHLLNEPALTLALWKDLNGMSPAKLWQVGPDQYQGTDGAGTTATWHFVFRSPRLHVLLCHLEYVSPRGATRLNGRIVLVVHTEYFQKGPTEPWVRHHVEAFVKIDSRGWRTVAKTVRPIIEKVLEDQVQEAGWFVSLMGRLVELYPNWAVQVAQREPELRPEVRQNFCTLVQRTRRPNAFTGRPTLAENGNPSHNERMR